MTIFDKIIMVPALLLSWILYPVGWLCWMIWAGLHTGFIAGEDTTSRISEALREWKGRR